MIEISIRWSPRLPSWKHPQCICQATLCVCLLSEPQKSQDKVHTAVTLSSIVLRPGPTRGTVPTMHSSSFSLFAAVLLLLATGGNACTNPDTDSCASAFSANLASASAFCKTFTTGTVTATTGLPSVFASACSSKTSKLSVECTCYVTGAAATTTSTAKVCYIHKSQTPGILTFCLFEEKR